MISDEMREVLSVYVDGELRDKDVARVEQMAKCDTEMSKEIQAYKLLRKKLRSWDKSEQDEGPSPLVREQAIRRARAYLRSRAQQRKGALLHLFLRPIALAAALLIAVALGIVVASGAETPQPGFVASNGSVALTPLADDEERTLPGALAAPDRATPVLLQERPGVSLIEDNGDRLMYEGRAYSREALNRKLKWAMEDALWALQKARLPGSASKSVPTVNIPVKVLLRDFSPAEAPVGSFVTMKHDGLLNLKGLQAMRPHKEPFKDPVAGEAHVIVRNTTEHPLLLIAGEVLVADDSTKRARIIASDYWIPGGDQEEGFVPIVWADTVATPAQRGGRLRLQAEILGNDLRRGTVARSGKDDAWVATLQKHISGTLPAALDRKLDEAKVKALLKPLSDANVTGFAILDGNRVRGVELFGSHTLLMSFAERLVRGYVRENGATIRVKPLSADAKKSALDSVREYIDSLPKRALSPQTKRSAPRLSASVWRKHGIENITLRGIGGKVLGHGLVQDDSLIHLTVFGE